MFNWTEVVKVMTYGCTAVSLVHVIQLLQLYMGALLIYGCIFYGAAVQHAVGGGSEDECNVEGRVRKKLLRCCARELRLTAILVRISAHFVNYNNCKHRFTAVYSIPPYFRAITCTHPRSPLLSAAPLPYVPTSTSASHRSDETFGLSFAAPSKFCTLIWRPWRFQRDDWQWPSSTTHCERVSHTRKRRAKKHDKHVAICK